MGAFTIINQILLLAILTAVGSLAFRFKILEESAKEIIQKLVFYITLPLLIVTKLSVLEFTDEILKNGGLVVLFSFLIMILQLGLGKLSARFFALRKPQAVIHSLHHMLGNVVFLGFPLVDTLIPGGEALLYAALYQLVLNALLWSYGVIQLNPDDSQKGLKQFKKLINPNTIALSLGLIMMLLKIRLPDVLQQSLGGLGSTTTYLAMLYIGILLAQMKMKEIFSISIFTFSFTKLVFSPLIFMLSLLVLINYFLLPLNSVAFTVLVLESAMPGMTILVLLAKRYGADDALAMKNFFVSTVLSLITLPLILYLIQWSQN
ncbi:MAG TPA: transporter [Bacteroidales bacterium]|nr:transporter [Bacteroidales bacterium]